MGIHQAAAQDQIFGHPGYSYACVVSNWGNTVFVARAGRAELYESAYTTIAGGVRVRGYQHQDFIWTGSSGRVTARFDFALCAEIAVGMAYSTAEISVTAFLRDVTTTKFPIQTVLFRYVKNTPGYNLFIDGGVFNIPVEMVNGHRYTIGYTVDVAATCYPRSYCPMAFANMGEQGCSFWWQPTGVFDG